MSKKISGKEIFSIMFQKMKGDDILRFLGNESTFFQDLNIISKLPNLPFLKAGIKQLLKK